MKKAILCILLIAGWQHFIGQNQMNIQHFVDTTQIVKEINFHKDTLWVMDSSHSYNFSINYELQLSGIYKVLTRDEEGNKLTGLGKVNRHSGSFENTHLDSLSYFSGTNDVRHSYTFYWNFLEEKWMDNIYKLFDENLNLIEQYNKGWNLHQNQYINGNRITYEFDNDLLLSTISSIYLPESGTWEPNENEVCYYNEYGKDSVRLKLKWNIGTEQWENKYRDETFYNELGKDSIRLKLIWDIVTEQWENEYRNETFYNELFNHIDSYGSYWDKDLLSWINDIYSHSTYNEIDFIDTTTVSIWNEQENKWVFDRKTIVIHNEAGQRTEYLIMLYDNQNGNWINNLKFTYSYNDLNALFIKYEWDIITETWIPDYREFRSFIIGNTTDTVQYDNWDSISQQWIFSHRSINIFDERLNQTENIRQVWDNADETWRTMQQKIFFWSPFNPLNVVEFEHLKIKVYPNPATKYVIFETNKNVILNASGGMRGSAHEKSSQHNPQSPPQITITNTLGQQVAQLEVKGSKTVLDIRGYKPGVYFYFLQMEGKRYSGKLVIQK